MWVFFFWTLISLISDCFGNPMPATAEGRRDEEEEEDDGKN